MNLKTEDFIHKNSGTDTNSWIFKDLQYESIYIRCFMQYYFKRNIFYLVIYTTSTFLLEIKIVILENLKFLHNE